jgi:hypothetical protein
MLPTTYLSSGPQFFIIRRGQIFKEHGFAARSRHVLSIVSPLKYTVVNITWVRLSLLLTQTVLLFS